MNRNLTIIGIDPGTTTGIAIVSLEGKFIFAGSQKDLGLNELIKKVIGFGKPILIGTDKAKIPSLVEQSAAKTGSRIISPSEDLKVADKRELVQGLDASNQHEHDALAAALFALRRTRPTIEKVISFASENKKEHLKDKLLEYVVGHELSIHEAISLLEEKKVQSRIVKRVVEEKRLSKEDYIALFKKCEQLESEMVLLQRHNRKLMHQIKGMEAPKIIRQNSGKKALEHKEKSIAFLTNELKRKQDQIELLQKRNNDLHSLLLRWDEIVIIKKMNDLGMQEYERFKHHIRKDSTLFIENSSIVSSNVIELIKNNVKMLLVDSKPSKALQVNFSIINIALVPHKKYGQFIILRKKDFEELSKRQDFSQIVAQYQKERDYTT